MAIVELEIMVDLPAVFYFVSEATFLEKQYTVTKVLLLKMNVKKPVTPNKKKADISNSDGVLCEFL